MPADCYRVVVSIAQAVCLLECEQTDRQTDKQTDATERYTHAGDYSAVVEDDVGQIVIGFMAQISEQR